MFKFKESIKKLFSTKHEFDPKIYKKCNECNGSGLGVRGYCLHCVGKGYVEKTLEDKISEAINYRKTKKTSPSPLKTEKRR